jgi:predicted AlkP superfamily phosphohydrolase/phosphomutase
MTRLLVIGIDGMDPYVFEKLIIEMPHLSSIYKAGNFKHCDSVFPPDSIPAWVTIFTGEYPEAHGWLDNIDYEDIRRGVEVNKLCELQGRTFWDKISTAGKRVCVINPLLAYPAWPVNGIMASGPVFITGEKQIYPENLASKYPLPELGGMTQFPAENKLDQFLDATLQSTRDLAQFGLDLYTSEKWDLFFISFFTLDRIQHFLWRFWDPSDPLYPGPSSLQDGIRKAYITFDEIVGRFLEQLDHHTGLMVLSDHGHGQRPTLLININELLRQEGLLLTSQELNKKIPIKQSTEMLKNTSVKWVTKILGERWLYRIGRLMPKRMRKSLKKSTYLIDKENSHAWVSDLGGGASVGGITINPKINRQSMEYKRLTETIIQDLEKVIHEDYGPVVQWSKVTGKDSLYPDIIFELNPLFSVGRSLFCALLEVSSRHRIISGGHKKEGIFFEYNCGGLVSKVNSLHDISNTIQSFVLSDKT